MARPSFDSLIAPLTQAQVFSSMVRILGLLGVDVTSWSEGAPYRTLLALTAAVQAGYTAMVADLAKTSFLETASGGWLRLVAWYRYGVASRDATQASGYVTLTNTSINTYELDPGDLVLYPTGGRTRNYTNVEAFTLAPSSTATVQVQCDVVGSLGNLAANSLVTTLPSLSGVTIAQPAAITGLDPEAEASLRARCLEKVRAISGAGAASVYDYWSKAAVLPHGGVVTQTRVGTGSIFETAKVLVGGPDELDATDLEALRMWLLRTAVPQGVRLDLQVADVVPIHIALQVWSPTPLDAVAARSAAVVALGALFAEMPIGGYTAGSLANRVFRSGVEGAVMSALLNADATLPRPRYVTATLTGASTDGAGNAIVTLDQLPTLGNVDVQVIV